MMTVGGKFKPSQRQYNTWQFTVLDNCPLSNSCFSYKGYFVFMRWLSFTLSCISGTVLNEILSVGVNM